MPSSSLSSSSSSSSSSAKRRPKPLMLKDFLRLDNPNYDTTSVSGFRPSSSTTVVFLFEVDARKNIREAGAAVKSETLRWRTTHISSKLSALLNTVKTLPFLSSERRSGGAGRTILPRSFSRRFAMRNFWKKRIIEEEELKNMNGASFSRNKVLIRDIIRFGSFLDVSLTEKHITSGRNSFSSGSSGWSESTISTGTSSESDSVPSSSSPISSEFTKTEKMPGSGDDTVVTVTCRCEDPKENGGMAGACNRCEDNEQSSPVSVMDFSYAEEDGEEEEEEEPATVLCSELQNKRHHLIQKIRQFKSFSQLVDPIPLQRSFNSELEPEFAEEEDGDDEDEEEGARELLEELKSTEIQTSDLTDRLLLDFFTEGLWSDRRKSSSRTARWVDVEDQTVKEDLLSTSINWIKGSELEASDDWVELQRTEMNNDKQWKCFHVEERDEMAADMESLVIGSLIDDLIVELIMA